MNDPTAPIQQPPYWGKCEKMNFGELSRFIDNALKSLSEPGANADLPNSKEKFLTLWEMLREKYDAEITSLEPLQQPDKLTAKRARRRRLIEHVDKLRNARSKKHKKKGREIREAEQKIEQLDREIDEMEDSGNYSAYIPRTLRGDPRWRTLWEIRAAITSAFESGDNVPATRLAWRLAASDEGSAANVPRPDEDPDRQDRLVGFDQDRVDNVKLLRPKHRYEGIDGFDGYSVFTFAYTSKALMECFIKGNAIFVVGSDLGDRWQTMNKQELRTHPSVTWIPHRGKLSERVLQELGSDDSRVAGSTLPPAFGSFAAPF